MAAPAKACVRIRHTLEYTMSIRIPRSIALALVLGALAACSPSASTPSGNSATVNNAAPAKTGNACDRKLLTPDDMTGILGEPITGTAPLKGDAQTCYFITATTETRGGAEIMISVRPGLGEATLATFTSGQMNAYAKSMPLAGVGDSAVWLPETSEVDAQKNNLLCVAGLGGSAVIGHKPDDLPKKLGALCNKVFATY
jgi:hypothetical protein